MQFSKSMVNDGTEIVGETILEFLVVFAPYGILALEIVSYISLFVNNASIFDTILILLQAASTECIAPIMIVLIAQAWKKQQYKYIAGYSIILVPYASVAILAIAAKGIVTANSIDTNTALHMMGISVVESLVVRGVLTFIAVLLLFFFTKPYREYQEEERENRQIKRMRRELARRALQQRISTEVAQWEQQQYSIEEVQPLQIELVQESVHAPVQASASVQEGDAMMQGNDAPVQAAHDARTDARIDAPMHAPDALTHSARTHETDARTTEDKVRALMQAYPDMPASGIADTIGVHRTTVSRIMKRSELSK